MMFYLKIYKDTGILKCRKISLRTIFSLLLVVSDAQAVMWPLQLLEHCLAISHAWIQIWDASARKQRSPSCTAPHVC